MGLLLSHADAMRRDAESNQDNLFAGNEAASDLIGLGIFSHIFPGPLARQKMQLTAQQRAKLRDKVIAQRHDKLVWWASPLPMMIVVMVIVIYETVT